MTGRHFRFGIVLAMIVFAADQATKNWLLYVYKIARNGPFDISANIQITEVWNAGISYGLLRQDGLFGQLVLVSISVLAAGMFCLWLARTPSRIVAFALALIIGGALGNAVDRAIYGAVFDFVHLHVGNFSWYVFNLADTAIVVGVIALIYDSLRGLGRSETR